MLPTQPRTLVSIALSLVCAAAAAQQTPVFTPGDVVVLVEGCGQPSGTCTYTDNQGTPMTLFQYKPTGTGSATYVNALVLPQTASGANLPVSAEYGSSSEGTLQLSGDGRYLTFMGYGIDFVSYNANPSAYGTLAAKPTALAQSGSLTGQGYTPIARVVALVDPNGNVNSTTGLFNVFNLNNPRSVFTADGFNAYVSGQGSGSDATGGVFLTPLGAINNAPTPITGLDTTTNTLSQETRTVQIYNGTLWVSVDTKEGSNNARSYLGTLGTPPATTLFSPVGTKGGSNGPLQWSSATNANTTQLSSTSKVTLTASETNGINSTGQQINLSPYGFFFANAYTVYVADSGNPKQNSATSLLGDGGLQKWVNTKTDGTGVWQLQYTLSAGLNLVQNPAANASSTAGTTGLYGVTGVVSGSTVNLYVTNSTIGDLDPTYLYGITDTVGSTTKPGTAFTLLASAPADSNFKGVAMAPAYPLGSATLTSVPSGLNITVAGTGCVPGTYATPVTLVWTPGSTCTLSSTATQGTTPYVFTQWQDGTTSLQDAVTATSTPAVYTASFSTTYQPVGALEKVVDNATPSTSTLQQGDSLLVSGWVADPVDGSPLSNVKVYVDGTLFGTPTLGIARPDVAAATGNSTYANSGYQLVGSTSSLALGTHAVTVIGIDSAAKSTTFGPVNFSIVATPQVTVSAVTTTQGTASTTLTASVAYTGPAAPTGGLSFTVNGSATGVGVANCTGSASPLTCTASYAPGSLGAGPYSIVATEAASGTYNSASGTNTLTVNAPSYSYTVTPGSSSIAQGTASTALTATLSYTGPTAPPASGLSFTVNGSSVGIGPTTCAIVNTSYLCTATYATGSLSAGSYTVVATEAAATYYSAASGTATLTISVADFTFQTTGSASQTVSKGSSANFLFNLAPTSSLYPSAVTFSVSGLPTGATYSISPSSVAVAGGAQMVTLTVQTSATAALHPAVPEFWNLVPKTLLALFVVPLVLRRRRRMPLICCGALLLLSSLTGCGGGGQSSGKTSSPVTAQITVTAASGTVQHSASVVLTAQ